MSDDITFCGSECNNKKCFRHPSNIAEPNIHHSFAYLKDTDMCPMKKQEIRLIDANALKEEVNKKNVVGRFNTIMLIDNAPTVECVALTKEAYSDLCLRASRERPKGEWVVKEGTVACYTACNKCDYADYNHKRPNYCPNCGADMRGEK